MIKRIEALNYRGFRYLDISLNRFNILIGPNASGKSTFLDILSFVSDIIRRGLYKAVKKRCGYFQELLWKLGEESNRLDFAIELELPEETRELEAKYIFKYARYEIGLSINEEEEPVITREYFWLLQEDHEKKSLIKNPENFGESSRLSDQELEFPDIEQDIFFLLEKMREKCKVNDKTGWHIVALRNNLGESLFDSELDSGTGASNNVKLTESFFPFSTLQQFNPLFYKTYWTQYQLEKEMHYIQLNNKGLKEACRGDAPMSLEPGGESLAKILKSLKEKHPSDFSDWVDHVKTSLRDIEKIEIVEQSIDRSLQLKILYESGVSLSNRQLSDGTLYYLALTVIPYLKEKSRLYMIEEPENGLHPQAIESVMQSLNSVYDGQVFVTTHSPVILNLAKPEDFLCFQKKKSGELGIVRGDEHPVLKNWKSEIDLDQLFASGVL